MNSVWKDGLAGFITNLERSKRHPVNPYFIGEIRGLKSAWRRSSLQVVLFRYAAVVLAWSFDWNGLSLAG